MIPFLGSVQSRALQTERRLVAAKGWKDGEWEWLILLGVRKMVWN